MIVTARYGLLYLPRKNLFSLENMHTYMMGILGNMIFRGLKKRKKKKINVRSIFLLKQISFVKVPSRHLYKFSIEKSIEEES